MSGGSTKLDILGSGTRRAVNSDRNRQHICYAPGEEGQGALRYGSHTYFSTSGYRALLPFSRVANRGSQSRKEPSYQV